MEDLTYKTRDELRQLKYIKESKIIKLKTIIAKVEKLKTKLENEPSNVTEFQKPMLHIKLWNIRLRIEKSISNSNLELKHIKEKLDLEDEINLPF